MAEELDPKVTSAYRELRAEEPPRALDEAILAAARRPARPWTQRWAVPLSLAAVVALSVTVTLRIQHEAPELPSTATQPPAPAVEAAREEVPLKLKPEGQIKSRAKPAEKAEAPRAEPKAFADAPASAAGSAARNDAARMEAANRDLAEVRREMARSAESGSSGSALSQLEERTSRDAEAAARAPQAGALLAKQRADRPASAAAPAAPAVAAAKPAPVPPPASAPAPAPARAAKLAEQAAKEPADTPEREFDRIARLRAEGKHEEADKAFLEFRRRYPDFRISEDMLKRVERPQGAR